MDREKAADLLDNLIGMVEDNHGADYDTALKMGIEALSTSGDGLEPVDDTIFRQAAIDAAIEAINEWGGGWDAEREARDAINALPSAQPELAQNLHNACTDLISRQAAIDAMSCINDSICGQQAIDALCELPSAQSDLITKIQNGIKVTNADDVYSCGMRNGMRWCMSLIDGKEPLYENCPSAQPERTCVNCGRTANNGGWYADGGTRCPIEEHYALPKDGYCHLWEKRNVTDDDYTERREE